MRRVAILHLLILIMGCSLSAGCSTAPVADLMDYFSPGRMGPETTPPYGGVAAPHPGGQSMPPGAVVGPGLPPLPPAPPASSPASANLGAIGPPPAADASPADTFGPPR